MRPSTIFLLLGIVSAAGFALIYGTHASPAPTLSASLPPPPTNQAVDETMGAGMETSELPPNHPPINGTSQNDPGVAPDEEPEALTWKAPPTWPLVPNPNKMRLATYKVSDAELVVSRAGGDIAANIQRWTGQFGASFTLKQSSKTIHDLKVTQVMIDGTYEGGMTGGAGSHDNWSMLAAIVETKGQPYFFKLLGPAATVRASQKAFEAMLDGVTAS